MAMVSEVYCNSFCFFHFLPGHSVFIGICESNGPMVQHMVQSVGGDNTCVPRGRKASHIVRDPFPLVPLFSVFFYYVLAFKNTWEQVCGTIFQATSPINLLTYTGQKKVALLDVETHDNPIPVESYTMRQGKVWAVICHPGKPFIIINLKRCDK